MMNEFMQQGPQMPEAFAMQHDLHQNQHMRAGSSSPGLGGWAQEFNPGVETQARMEAAFQAPKGTAFSPADFQRFQQMGPGPVARTASPMQNGFSSYQSPQMGMGMGMMGSGMGMGMGMMNRSQFQQPQQNFSQQEDAKGKGKMIELDDEHWEEQFKQIDLEAREQDEAMAGEAELNEMDRSVLESETNEFGDFESIWKGIQAETAAARDLVTEENIAEHMGDFDQWDGFDGMGTHQSPFRDPNLGEYMFEEDNLFKDVSNPFEEGVRIMHEGGNLSLAALAFEAAVQKDPQHIDAWVLLGSAQAQNEKETPAIRALEQAVKLDPNNLTALMGLAVSYTNEGYDSTAYRTLERWLSIKYPSIIQPSELSNAAEVGFTDRHILHDKVTNHFIRAAQLSPHGDHMDPDVQVGLGVLFYGAEEYDKAVDCFSAALASTESGTSNQRDQVHLLWNRLGATLANSGRSEEAINAYEKALTLRTNFVRARYNLGVSCINIGCYEEAAGHLLGALAMHKVVENEGREKARDILSGGATGLEGVGSVSEAELERMISQNQSTNLYDTLRRVFSQMGRRDLAERVKVGMDVEAFRGDFDF
jgi:peroxin-5